MAYISDGETTWNYTYDADGLRTQRTNGTTTYKYYYNGSQLSRMTVGNTTLDFTYDANGTPLTITRNGEVYYYVTNLQGDVVAILNDGGIQVADYVYDAWGNFQSNGAEDIDLYNPLTYRGYIYDHETGLYYLQSRYYNPKWGRFINADGLISTGQGMLGYNMFGYCNNNPIKYVDPSGYSLSGILNSYQTAFSEAARALRDLFVIAGVVTQLDSPAPGLADVVGGAIATAALAACTAIAVANVVDEIAEDVAVAVDSIAKSLQDTAMYYGADMYGGTWKIVTPPMNYEAATMWVGATAASGVYGKNASWGLYTPDQDSALKMAMTLGGPGPHLHGGNIGQYNHYHVFGMLLFGEYKHFHIWYGNIWRE